MRRLIFACFLTGSLVGGLSTQDAYRIVESGTSGKIVVATRDFTPGELVLEEKEPLLFIPRAQEEYKHMGLSKILPAFRTFVKDTPLDKKRKLLSLFGPTTGVSADRIRECARSELQYRFSEADRPRLFSPEELEMFVKVAQVVKMNMFGGDDGFAIYEDITRFAHSCDANCAFKRHEKSIRCYATRFIHAGKELTISYVADRDINPIHERRYNYLLMKEFTCHCPRCGALGDDTRQFECVDSTCNGVMLARQPISTKKLPVHGLSYTDVEYEEPHLLPCTVCHCTAPADYQAKMLELEAQLPNWADLMWQECEDIRASGMSVDRFDNLLRLLHSKNFPRRHAASLPLLNLEWRLKHILFLLGDGDASYAWDALTDYIACFENVLPNPHSEMSTALTLAVSTSLWDAHIPSPFSPQDEKELCQKALRMHLLISGRESRDQSLDESLARALQKLPPAGLTDVCTFCEESPARAAMKRSRCGQCKQAVYCSVGCQKAHWPLHKKTCKAQQNK